MNLDSDQQSVLANPTGARCVQAGPGTGKTTTMLELYNKLRASGIPASEIRGVTFSKSMAEQLEKRANVKGVFSTFHSLGYLIASEVERKPVEPELRYRLMCKLCSRWGCDYKDLDGFIGRMKRAGIMPEEASESGEHPYAYCAAYIAYEEERQKAGWIDFDGMLYESVQYLENKQNRLRWQVKHLIVDEAQDTDNIQWRMAQLLTEKHGNITIVGDPNQAIYGFRGAKPENLTNFEQWFPGGRQFYLGKNYRSTRRIVKFVRENAPRDTPKELLEKMTAARNVEGDPIAIKMYWTDEQDAESALALANVDPLNSIILARTNRWVGLLERLCNRNNIKYHLRGEAGFWKQGEIRKAVEMLKEYPTLRVDQAMSMVMPGLRRKYDVDDRTEKDNDALENLAVLQEIAKRDFKMNRDFTVYANKMIHRRNDPRGVTISTIHQAKGGEWKRVYLIGARAESIPHKKGDPIEEERLYFVAISRPIDYLRISWAGTPSPYLRKYLPEEVLDRLRKAAAEVETLQKQQGLFEEPK